MKFSKYQDDFEEEFTSIRNLDTHYTKHKNQYQELTKEEYEKLADNLALRPVDNRHVFGYESDSGSNNRLAFCKYDKDTGDFVVYRVKNGKREVVTFYNKTWQQYIGDKAVDYNNEIPKGI